MLKRMLCELQVDWQLSCDGPLLIKDGRYQDCREGRTKEGGYPDCLFISRTTDAQFKKHVAQCAQAPPQMPFYVPGTSIRGPFRAQAEKIVRTLLPENAASPVTACDPFDEKEGRTVSCSRMLQGASESAPYARVCPACRIFGCAGLASRIRFEDADIGSGYRSVYRDMIGIDRFTGGVYKGETTGAGRKGGALMRLHALEGATFRTRITLTNYEMWHIGLMAYVLRDFEDGLVPIGFGKTKGFGQVRGKVESVAVRATRMPERFDHLGSLLSDDDLVHYGICKTGPVEFDRLEKAGGGRHWYHVFRVADTGALFEEAAGHFNRFAEMTREQSL